MEVAYKADEETTHIIPVIATSASALEEDTMQVEKTEMVRTTLFYNHLITLNAISYRSLSFYLVTQ